MLNSQIKLLLKIKADCWQSNLLIIEQFAIIILDKYNQSKFHNIVLAYSHFDNNDSN